LHDGFLRVYEYEFDVEKHGDGITRLLREVMERGNAVAVLGHDPSRDEVVLGNQFRPGVMVNGEYPYRDNLVAGAIDENETALQAAVREMREETGLVLSNPVLIPSGAYVSSGWRAPLAVFVVIVVGGVAVPGGRDLGIGLVGFGAACSAIIAYILSITATLNQNIIEMMHEVDSSLQLVDYSFDVLGDSRLKLNSARGEWQIDIPTKSSAPWVRFRGPNELHRVIGPGPGFTAEAREMMGSAGS
jgi:8-oxo-dGTP pyrophosphatase MutT (NUDIX family)